MLTFPGKVDFTSLAFNDPISKETEKKRAHLLFVACTSILVNVYGLQIKKTPWVELDVPQDGLRILHGVLSVGLAYTLFVFLLYIISDILRWWTARESLRLQGYETALARVGGSLKTIGLTLAEENRTLMRDKGEYRRLEMNLLTISSQVEELTKDLARVNRRHKTLGVIQAARLSIVDALLPLALGFFALLRIGHEIGPFLRVMLA